MPPERDLRAAAERIESLLDEVSALGDAKVRAKAEELVRLLMSLYGDGLDRMMEIVAGDSSDSSGGSDSSDGSGERIFQRFAEDGLVSSLLVLHGLHPVDLETRILRALDGVRPYLGSHGGDIKFLSVEDGLVRLRLEGACQGCASSAITMKLAVEHAIEKAAPEVIGIEVEGLEAAAATGAQDGMGSTGLADATGVRDATGASGSTASGGARDEGLLQIGQTSHGHAAHGPTARICAPIEGRG